MTKSQTFAMTHSKLQQCANLGGAWGPALWRDSSSLLSNFPSSADFCDVGSPLSNLVSMGVAPESLVPVPILFLALSVSPLMLPVCQVGKQILVWLFLVVRLKFKAFNVLGSSRLCYYVKQIRLEIVHHKKISKFQLRGYGHNYQIRNSHFLSQSHLGPSPGWRWGMLTILKIVAHSIATKIFGCAKFSEHWPYCLCWRYGISSSLLLALHNQNNIWILFVDKNQVLC